jgi:hypothetical protein
MIPLILWESGETPPSDDPGAGQPSEWYEGEPLLVEVYQFPQNEKLFEVELPPRSRVRFRRQ